MGPLLSTIPNPATKQRQNKFDNGEGLMPADAIFHVAKLCERYSEVLTLALVCKAWHLALESLLWEVGDVLAVVNEGNYDDTMDWETRFELPGGASWRKLQSSLFTINSSLQPRLPNVLENLVRINCKLPLCRVLPHCWKSGVLYFDRTGELGQIRDVHCLFTHRQWCALPLCTRCPNPSTPYFLLHRYPYLALIFGCT